MVKMYRGKESAEGTHYGRDCWGSWVLGVGKEQPETKGGGGWKGVGGEAGYGRDRGGKVSWIGEVA